MTSEQTTEIVEEYGKHLRELFDSEKIDIVAVSIIAEALRLGYNELAEKMKQDLAISSRFFDTVHENAKYINYRLILLSESLRQFNNHNIK